MRTPIAVVVVCVLGTACEKAEPTSVPMTAPIATASAPAVAPIAIAPVVPVRPAYVDPFEEKGNPDTAHVLADEQVPREPAEDELAEMQKKRIPMPPSQERAAYLAWKKQLPKATRARVDRYCREWGGEYRVACNGIGPLALPIPPSLVGEHPRDRDGRMLSMTHAQWESNLTPAQRRYYEDYCRTDESDGEGNGYSQLCGGTPLVLAFADERVEYTASSTGPSDWPTTATPWLALDRDGDGAITDAAELFGSSTILDGRAAKHGFEALAALDANRDGVIDAQDPAFATLLLWADRDGDRQSSSSELTALSASVVSLSLDYHRVPHCDDRMNCEGERAPMQWRDATGATRTGSVVDVYLRYR